jgi:hypothetical protein
VRDPEIACELDMWKKYIANPFDKSISKSQFNDPPEVIVIDDTPDFVSEYLSRIQELTLMNQQLTNRIADIPIVDPQMINAYVAKMIVKSVMSEICPVSLEPLSIHDEFAVGICGHVCCSQVKMLNNCPVCRASTKWQVLKKSDI